ncbi:MAG: ABC transporter permease [Bacteroidales bacterium]|nr:ABC transporter permease [Bacteroidales bacterium]
MNIIRLILESLIMAVQAVTVNRLRAMLSLLGITIGIFAIIAVFTIVDSLETNIRESVNSLGSDIVYIEKWPWAPEEGEEFAWWKYMNRPLATYDEFEFIREKCRSADDVCFMSAVGRRIEYGNNNVEGATLFGVSEGFEKIRSFELEQGRYFTPLENNSGRNVVVIGTEIAKDLFQGADPVGKYVEMLGRKVMVIGVIEKEGKGSFDAFIMDEVAVLPIHYYKGFIDLRSEMSNPQIWVKAKEKVGVEELTFEVTQLLRSYRKLKPSEENNFALNQTSIINNQLDQFFAVLKIAGFFIGIFSIIVGGFGIANIMFVSVKERTHIIGIQKALGAKKYFILLQFLFESIMLSLAGGIVGLLIVFLGATLINLSSDFSVYLTMNNILMGVGISSSIGLISGIFPAWQGARMDPVVAINTSF